MDTEMPSLDPNRDTPTTAPPPPGLTKGDTERLHEMGYAQELLRKMGGFSNIAINIGWPLVGIMVTIVGLAMAEVCSSYPTAGGLYYWSAKLAKRNSAAWSWFTGWFNLLGQFGITAGIDFGLSFFSQGLLHLLFNYPATKGWTVITFAIVLFLHALMNTFGIRLVALLNDISVWWP